MRNPQKMSVMLVDDQESMLELGENTLREIGFEDIRRAHNGRDAVKQLTTDAVDLIISEVNMDDVDGLKLLKLVRGHPTYKDTPFVMVASTMNMSVVTDGKQLGLSNYLMKPYNTDQLKKKLEQVFGRLIIGDY